MELRVQLLNSAIERLPMRLQLLMGAGAHLSRRDFTWSSCRPFCFLSLLEILSDISLALCLLLCHIFGIPGLIFRCLFCGLFCGRGILCLGLLDQSPYISWGRPNVPHAAPS